MQYLLLVYIDPALMEKVPAETFNTEMRQCLQHSDELTQQGKLKAFQQLEPPATAKAVRTRQGRTSIVDGPFAETKEVLAGFNLVEAASMEEALRMAEDLPWKQYGCIEVRPLADIDAMRQRVGA
ncbi:MAG TPA: YciI family protein [Steroidobacteraceae bacterium]|nr:YciI family protein [Steroidobacteraceae bacterium]